MLCCAFPPVSSPNYRSDIHSSTLPHSSTPVADPEMPAITVIYPLSHRQRTHKAAPKKFLALLLNHPHPQPPFVESLDINKHKSFDPEVINHDYQYVIEPESSSSFQILREADIIDFHINNIRFPREEFIQPVLDMYGSTTQVSSFSRTDYIPR